MPAIQITPHARRSLLEEAPPQPPPLTPEQSLLLRQSADRATHLLRRARVLGDAEFADEAFASLREALLPLATAVSLARRLPIPTTSAELQREPWNTLWPGIEDDAEHLGSDLGNAWASVADRFSTALESLRASLPD